MLPKRALQGAATTLLLLVAAFPSRRTALAVGVLLLPSLTVAFATFRASLG